MTCNPDHWHTLWDVFNTHRADEIRVPRDALLDAMTCHREAKGMETNGLIVGAPRDGSKTVLVNRAALFVFLNAHGALRCDAPEKR